MKSFLLLLGIPLISSAGAAAYIGVDVWNNNRQNDKNAAIFADQELMNAVAGAGYRLKADFGSPIVAYCDRRNDTGPLPCGPFPQGSGVDIRVATR